MDFDSVIYPPGLCPRISLQVDLVSRSHQPCSTCSLPFSPGQLRIQSRSKHYHLPCFTPELHMRIEPQFIRKQVQGDDWTRFELWLTHYNSQFLTVSVKEIDSWTVSISGKFERKRHLLEVFKYLPIHEIAWKIPLVSKSWRAHSLDPEIWSHLLSHSYPLSHTNTKSASRSTYLYHHFLSCYGCACLLSPSSEVLVKHPVTSQPLCKTCFPKQFYNPALVSSFCEFLGVSKDYLKAANVRIFPIDSKYCVMPFEAKPKIIEYRRKRLQKISDRGGFPVSIKKYWGSVDLEGCYKKKDVEKLIANAPNPTVSAQLRYLFYSVESSAVVAKRPATAYFYAVKRAKIGY